MSSLKCMIVFSSAFYTLILTGNVLASSANCKVVQENKSHDYEVRRGNQVLKRFNENYNSDPFISALKEQSKLAKEGICVSPPNLDCEVLQGENPKDYQIKAGSHILRMFYGDDDYGSLDKALRQQASFAEEGICSSAPKLECEVVEADNLKGYKLKAGDITLMGLDVIDSLQTALSLQASFAKQGICASAPRVKCEVVQDHDSKDYQIKTGSRIIAAFSREDNSHPFLNALQEQASLTKMGVCSFTPKRDCEVVVEDDSKDYQIKADGQILVDFGGITSSLAVVLKEHDSLVKEGVCAKKLTKFE